MRKKNKTLIKLGPGTSLYLLGCATYGVYHTILFVLHGAF